jgi:hypothetical protein
MESVRLACFIFGADFGKTASSSIKISYGFAMLNTNSRGPVIKKLKSGLRVIDDT